MRFPFKYRIALIIFILEAVMMTAVLWATLDHLENATREQFASSERAILEVVSGISHIAIQTGVYTELQLYLENLLEDSRIEQVMLVDSRGIVVAATRPESIGKFPAIFSEAATIDQDTQVQRIWRSTEIRNGKQRLGVLAIQISDAEILKTQAEARNLGIGIAVTGMIIIAVVGLVAGVLLTRRLAHVTDAAHKFAHGDADARAGLRGQDEIGDLGQTFDLMADNLQASAVEARQLIDQLSDKNEELERFAYTVSHDLKTPLVTIKGYLGMVQKDLLEDRRELIERDFEFIVSATDTMAQLLEDLLELSRVGQVVNESEEVGLTDLFRQTSRLMDIQVAANSTQLSIQELMPLVFVDRQRMTEVAQNLLENALKFSRSGSSPEVSVSAHEEQGRVICCVKDNGIGIEPKFQDQIFGLFNRLDQSYEGTGIGLTLVKRIIEVHQGNVWVESDGIDKGTRFCFSLPSTQVAV
ncbi:MAG: HAMP domain-containing histidine kinase [Gammaproteobacteria bacterium]|nr:HAMP domain-containing histidine kinase [Gammaproteobacteria bacterium]